MSHLVHQWGHTPPPICGHTLTRCVRPGEDGFDRLVLAFGSTEGLKDELSAGLFVLDMATHRWESVVPEGHAPPGRTAHSATQFNNEQMAVFGGSAGRQGLVPSDLLVLSLSPAGQPLRAKWDVLPAGTEGSCPTRRYGHAMVTLPDSPVIAMFGGNDGAKPLNDLWLFNYTVQPHWAPATLAPGPLPPATMYHSLSIRQTDGLMVVYGGRGADKDAVGGVWVLQQVPPAAGVQNSWNGPYQWQGPVAVETPRLAPPVGRFNHSAAFVGDQLVIFGGTGAQPGADGQLVLSALSDVAIVDTRSENGQWRWIEEGPAMEGLGELPARSRHSCVVVDLALIMFGGLNLDGLRNDLLRLSLDAVDEHGGGAGAGGADDMDGAGGGAGAGGNHRATIGIAGTAYVIDNGTGPDELQLNRMASMATRDILLKMNAHDKTERGWQKKASQVITYLTNPKGLPGFCQWTSAPPIWQNEGSGTATTPTAGGPVHRSVLEMGSVQNRGTFAAVVIELCGQACEIMKAESRVLKLQSPIYVFGDLHGNMGDLLFFSQNLWKLGPKLTAGSFLFLGDYVDRGYNGPEVMAYLVCQKVMCPNKWFLLRGNHENRQVNGSDVDTPTLFRAQCRHRFAEELGDKVWEAFNQVFDCMPVAAIINEQIFCAHGGIPRPLNHPTLAPYLQAGLQLPPVKAGKLSDGRIEALDALPNQMTLCGGTSENDLQRLIALDCMWADPLSNEHEQFADPFGYVVAVQHPEVGVRHLGYGSAAIDAFLANNGLNRVLRGHEAKSKGVQIAKAAKVVTVFSDSKDHGLGEGAQCGCVLVEDKIHVILGPENHDGPS